MATTLGGLAGSGTSPSSCTGPLSSCAAPVGSARAHAGGGSFVHHRCKDRVTARATSCPAGARFTHGARMGNGLTRLERNVERKRAAFPGNAAHAHGAAVGADGAPHEPEAADAEEPPVGPPPAAIDDGVD